jgi:hypothetical protein
MANKNILTNGSKVSQIGLMYYAPVAVVPPYLTEPINVFYCFLAKPLTWDDNENPPVPATDLKSIKQVYKNMFIAKKIKTNDISPVIQRVDWTSGITYNYFQDDVDMFEKDANGYITQIFYVKNKYDQVFKCLWNNNDEPSTEEPYFEPGTYTANKMFQGNDGYKWKFLYTIDTGLKLKFMDREWMPVAFGSNTPNPLITSAGAGSLDVINVIDGGSGYDPGNSVVQVVITGDGTGAVATANVQSGVITDIVVTSPGSNYTYANVTIQSGYGANAILTTATSPVGGHGFDPVSELGCAHVMLTCEFEGDEGGLLPTDIDFHQLGLIVNPTTKQYNPVYANGVAYSTTTDIVVAPGSDIGFEMDEIIYQGNSNNPTFTATVLYFNQATNLLKLINTKGVPVINSPIFGQTSKSSRVVLSYNLPNFAIYSGYLAYIENRTGVQRSDDGIEQLKFVLGF